MGNRCRGRAAGAGQQGKGSRGRAAGAGSSEAIVELQKARGHTSLRKQQLDRQPNVLGSFANRQPSSSHLWCRLRLAGGAAS